MVHKTVFCVEAGEKMNIAEEIIITGSVLTAIEDVANGKCEYL